ncbi:nicotinate-nucleotide--dimethylbenzimidazole phosphoribosyltransferase [Fodinibius halophilus]|uniref:Nicotinate-nucleotide--dimethylbenzimidazole phosphoribosyltransferase n=1 Tax=Fodinibius halophilus TaxID=1736908 RepID=A0A6M1STH2_9BACT|nr:nicotinate-nucleotide--dimethylbenzimidazole phosphoribosyltransferase [Fodinibius halophilus]NGP86846.1 nicotinate-nucleotide--dimethylbenzimidazole phosphoribosyltransferase [Fodinibius halophilus]
MKEFDISAVAKDLEEALQHKIDNKTKPVGALGRLEEVALKVGLIQQELEPQLQIPLLAVFAGDHGIAAEGVVNAYPQEVTAQMVMNMVGGGAAVNVFCETHGLATKIIDAGVAAELPPNEMLIDRKVAEGTQNYTEVPAMTAAQCNNAIEAGAALVSQWSDEGTNIIGFGEMGIGNTSSAAIITSLITGKSIEECTGKGTGLDDEGVSQKAKVLAKAIEAHDIDGDPFSILQTFGGYEIAMIVGAVLQAAEQQMVILVDGFIATAAFMVACECYPDAREYGIFAHQSDEQGHRIQLNYLQANPLLQLGMRLGEGTGAAMAYPIVESAVNFLNEMASFQDAGVSQGDKE